MLGANKRSFFRASLVILVLGAFTTGWANNPLTEKIAEGWRNITEQALMDTVRELCAEKYGGRLTGTKGYDDAADWLAGRLAGAGLTLGGDNGGYFQEFPIPIPWFCRGRSWRWQLPARGNPAGKDL